MRSIARRSRAAEGEESVRSTRLRLCLNLRGLLCSVIDRKLKFQRILSGFSCRYGKYVWFIATYHVYKRLSCKAKKRVCQLSYITDRLRKLLPKGCVFYITRELTEDRQPHYHVLFGMIKDEYGRYVNPPSLRSTVLWKRKWELRDTLSFEWEKDSNDSNYRGGKPYYVDYSKGQLRIVDMGSKQRWFKYGVYRYLLYMFKYSTLTRYTDYMIYK